LNERVQPKVERLLMPAEWERHQATWLAWPKDPLTFPEAIIGKVEETYRSMAVARA